MYGNKAWQCESIRNYAAAERHFNETKPVKSRKGTWGSDERPLRRRSQHHYRLKHGTWQGRNFYDLVHYQTTLVRYWEPLANGDEVVSLLYHNSISSRDFMAAHYWHGYNRLDTTTGTTVAVPVSTSSYARAWGFDDKFDRPFSAHLVMEAGRKLIKDQSVMVPLASPIASEHLKERRAMVRKELTIIKDIMLIQFGRLSEREELDYQLGLPFSSSKAVGSTDWRTIKNLLADKIHSGIDTQEANELTQALIGIAEDVYDTLASRLAYSEGTVLPRWKLRANPNATTEPATKPTFEQFIKAYERTIMTALNLNDADDLRLIDDNGLFPAHDNVPQSRRFASPKLGGLSNNLINTLVARVDELANRLSKV
jgi:hypothetical protein